MDCAEPHVEAAAELLGRLGADSVSISPLSSDSIFADATAARDFWGTNRVAALFAADADLDIVIACLRNGIGTENILGHGIEPVGDRDWVAEARSGAGPMWFGDQLCICPSWVRPPASRQVLILDPGLAFGTGAHASTRLCLEWLLDAVPHGKTVIDYGCGSGVLGLAAALLGARSVQAVDIDPQARSATAANARRNGLTGQVRILASEETARLQPADFLVANILLRPLLELADPFSRLVNPGGRIALSGILAVQAEEGLGAYRRCFKMAAPVFDGEWALLHGVRAA